MSIFTDLVHAGKPAAGADGTAMTVPIHPSVAYAYDRAEDVEPSGDPAGGPSRPWHRRRAGPSVDRHRGCEGFDRGRGSCLESGTRLSGRNRRVCLLGVMRRV